MKIFQYFTLEPFNPLMKIESKIIIKTACLLVECTVHCTLHTAA